MKKTCFVISPIGKTGDDIRKNADEVLEYIINPICKKYGYSVIRADKMANSGLITKAIIEQIISSDLVIADLTGSNPNVFYELAIRHSYRKPAIQIIKGTVDIPFDVAGAEVAKREISSMMETIESGDIVHNPVSEVGTMLNISENSMKENKEALSALLMEIQRIPENFNTLEKNIETRLSQMASTIVETIKKEQIQDNGNPENKMLEILMNNLMQNPQKAMQGVDALMKLQEKIK